MVFRWKRALELAIKYKTHVDTVLGLRQRSLEQLGRGARETIKEFVEYNAAVPVDWEQIEAKILAEREAERARPGAVPYVEK